MTAQPRQPADPDRLANHRSGLRLGDVQEQRLRAWPKDRIRPKSVALGVISLLAEVDALRVEREAFRHTSGLHIDRLRQLEEVDKDHALCAGHLAVLSEIRNRLEARIEAVTAEVAALQAAHGRFAKAHKGLELAHDGKHPDGTPFARYQWEGAQENAQIEYWVACEELLATDPAQRGASILETLAELFDYTVKLEGASSAWFATRSYAVRPDVASDLGDRIRALIGDRALAGQGEREG